jgi:hypothetical protein
LAPIVLTIILGLVALTPLALADGSEGGAAPVQATAAPNGGFHIQGGRVVGTLVSFIYSSDNGPIQGFSVQLPQDERPGFQLLFQTVAVSGYSGVGMPSIIQGDVFTADGGVADLTVHDSPTALLQVMAKGPTQVAFVLAPGAEVESGDSGTAQAQQCVAVEKPVRGAIFSPDGGMMVQGGQVTATLTGPGMVLFRALPADGLGSPGDEHALCEAIGQRRVGAEVNIQLLESGPRVEALRYRSDAQVVITKVVRGHLELQVRGLRPDGTRLFLRLDPSVATAADARALRVSLDDAAVASGSLTDVLYAQGASPQDARYHALVQGPGLGLLTYIPRLTPGGVVLTIDALPPYPVVDAPTLVVMAVGVAVVALATFALFRRRL